MLTMPTPKETLDERITFRLLPSERAEAESLLIPRETLGDFIREAVQREIARRKRTQKKSAPRR